jgi:hypothetical protein
MLGVLVRVECKSAPAVRLLDASYGRMRGKAAPPDLTYEILCRRRAEHWSLTREGEELCRASTPAELLTHLDNDLVLQLQIRRPDLLFVHAAVLGCPERAVMLVAPSGGGKSTTAWALLHHGFTYLSDELGPVDVATLRVHPYPRGLALRDEPKRPYDVPRAICRTPNGLRVPADAMPARVATRPLRLGSVFFLHRPDGGGAPAVRRLTASEAAARLYGNTLNPLAHPASGLDAVVRIVTRAACFELRVGDLAATCALVSETACKGIDRRQPLWRRATRTRRVSRP